MAQEDTTREVDRFILEEIESVPHLEALLLIWRRRPKRWTVEDLAQSLYVKPEIASQIVEDLRTRKLMASESEAYFYESDRARDALLEEVDKAYKSQLVRISNMIHSKASQSVREFARAFRFK